MDSSLGFAEEIEFNELIFLEEVGRGAFGVVSRAQWRNINVAVKLISTESEKKAFITELKQLSRVSHPNIVQLYGACTSSRQPICLVMEYAEGGSLYNVLHGQGVQPDYKPAHAMSWALQCAKGVSYLHGMKPKPLIHRDLKPPNLLLINGGTVLKICDFGTACDAHTHMTNNKGSAAWMAPEVFEGSNYSEKCDVFSWGIILWEVLTRRKPFDEIGGPAFRIMWAVHSGTRPPLIAGCPKPIEVLMTKCWSKNPAERPSMSEVVRVMTHLFQYFKGADEPLVYPHHPSSEAEASQMYSSHPSQTIFSAASHPGGATITEAVPSLHKGEPVPEIPPVPPTKPIVVDVGHDQRRTSAPASLAASRENLIDSNRAPTPSTEMYKRYSADFSKLEQSDILAQASPPVKGHRRTGSHGNTINMGTIPAPFPSPHSTTAPDRLIHHSATAPAGLVVQGGPHHGRSVSWSSDVAPGYPVEYRPPAQGAVVPHKGEGDGAHGVSSDQMAFDMAIIATDYQSRPLAPNTNCPESMKIYEEHCKMADEYLAVQTEILLLQHRRNDLKKELEEDAKEDQLSSRFVEEYTQLRNENESLLLLQKNLKRQEALLRQQRTGVGV